ncbi:Nuclear hormone receptor family member nhr-86 [Caenorhabditis elegans]|uniref:Nuclear hormone receptor family member nhr-86 n=4 Tax=Caenorhabditis elegans TaxID=6239 RepID=NHR86_CAEEL|nr:Nuclear hormone receptor family member nhr-86 [Caenorhabditis elegans]Q965W2.2 RecName: Full=Nuclear hormone receptor family member nhr-86 [Caenorhabditis elegans]CCD70636.1 Nuclear hormone receptor family member nhr-86 [Caenorhabditis elegans]|eukprot:NP_503561.2 Nuclear hormone receptor family member nhr-86 [Caenorhabditis elegans]
MEPLDNTSLEESQFRPEKKEKSTCSICREDGDGYHFGAEACRACAAFFRRSVSLDKTYLCRGNNDCEITANIRCMCRSCRFAKCLEVGMNPAGVQQRRDTIGKREIKPDSTDLMQLLGSVGDGYPPTTSAQSALVEDLHPSFNDRMPILMKMRVNYRKMDNARLVIHRKDGQSLFKEKTPKAVNYKEACAQSIREVSLVADWVAWCFDDFVTLPMDQKKVLFRNFYTPFSVLEGAFLCHINDTSNALILPSGDYIDTNNLKSFFNIPDEEQPMTDDEIEKFCRMFKPSFELNRRGLVLPMMAEKIDVFEFFALCTFVFWDFGLDEQTDDCMMIGKSVKDRVMKELAFYLRCAKRLEEPSLRVASLLTLLPALQRCVRRFQEDIEITNVFNVYAPPKDFYDLVNGKFC